MDEAGCKCIQRGNEYTTKDFLIDSVRHLSRLYMNKTKGQEIVWKKSPPNWPANLIWKNPTSKPKDDVETLEKKFLFLRSVVPPDKLSEIDKLAFDYFSKGDMASVTRLTLISKMSHQLLEVVSIIRNNSLLHNDSQEATSEPVGLQTYEESLKLLNTVSLLMKSKKSPEKRQNEHFKEKHCKKAKMEMLNSEVNIQNEGKKICKNKISARHILPKPSFNYQCTDNVAVNDISEPKTAFPFVVIQDESGASGVNITFLKPSAIEDTSKTTHLVQSYSPIYCCLTAIDDLSQPSYSASSLLLHQIDNSCSKNSSSEEEISNSNDCDQELSSNNPAQSEDSGTWSHHDINTTDSDINTTDSDINTTDSETENGIFHTYKLARGIDNSSTIENHQEEDVNHARENVLDNSIIANWEEDFDPNIFEECLETV